ncbi:unnamed protein product [Anisakis simplex]|uniref:Uncharacterized protein n=1 Tax=Anisakis simplex TaxID=6269 RepID=A0A0M3KID7_ANISI|nr:unnamed protein product [Anisakis simplex]
MAKMLSWFNKCRRVHTMQSCRSLWNARFRNAWGWNGWIWDARVWNAWGWNDWGRNGGGWNGWLWNVRSTGKSRSSTSWWWRCSIGRSDPNCIGSGCCHSCQWWFYGIIFGKCSRCCCFFFITCCAFAYRIICFWRCSSILCSTCCILCSACIFCRWRRLFSLKRTPKIFSKSINLNAFCASTSKAAVSSYEFVAAFLDNCMMTVK